MRIESFSVTKPVIGSHAGRTTLEQRFVIPGVTASELAGLLWDSPAVGCDSLFGIRRHGQVERGRDYRLISGLVPAPTIEFDVWLREIPGETRRFCVEFTQPGRATPYLDGEFIWTLRTLLDVDGPATELHEQINTPEALRLVGRPLNRPPLLAAPLALLPCRPRRRHALIGPQPDHVGPAAPEDPPTPNAGAPRQ